jgi:hypothetical protein
MALPVRLNLTGDPRPRVCFLLNTWRSGNSNCRQAESAKVQKVDVIFWYTFLRHTGIRNKH